MSGPAVPRFTSVDYQRVEGRADRVVVLCDRDRPEGTGCLLGQRVDIDGAAYLVLKVEDQRRPMRKGEQVALWVDRGNA